MHATQLRTWQATRKRSLERSVRMTENTMQAAMCLNQLSAQRVGQSSEFLENKKSNVSTQLRQDASLRDNAFFLGVLTEHDEFARRDTAR